MDVTLLHATVQYSIVNYLAASVERLVVLRYSVVYGSVI